MPCGPPPHVRRGKSVEEATADILQVQLPALKERMATGELRVDNIDVFCEEGVFDVPSTRAILQAGKDMGLNVNFHGDELHPMNAAQVGFRLPSVMERFKKKKCLVDSWGPSWERWLSATWRK